MATTTITTGSYLFLLSYGTFSLYQFSISFFIYPSIMHNFYFIAKKRSFASPIDMKERNGMGNLFQCLFEALLVEVKKKLF